MNMFTENKDFYPTPKKLIDKMLNGLDGKDFRTIKTILEPSAGSGNIVKALYEKAKSMSYSYKELEYDIDCIELDANLRYILKGAGYRVIYNDFLDFETVKEYDAIVMNPPFSKGCEHLLKAISLQERNGGYIVCLLNAETLRNPFSNARKDLVRKLRTYNAKIEFLKETFAEDDAERITEVEVALVKIQLPAVERPSFIIEGLKKARVEREAEAYEETQLTENDFLKAIIAQYQLELEAGKNLIKEYYAMRPHILSSFTKDEEGNIKTDGGCILSLDLSKNTDKYSNMLSVNGYVKEVRRKYWKALFQNEAFTGKLTANLRQVYNQRVVDLEDYDFNMYNICEIQLDMQKNMIQGVSDTIVALFEEFSHKHYWYDECSQNIHYYNGWKTNSAYKVNPKVIIPLNAFRHSYFSNTKELELGHSVISKLSDIEKCFNFLDKGQTTTIDLENVIKQAKEDGQSKNISLKFFDVTFFKKGTAHIKFKSEELLKKFNIFGSQQKAWLPPSYAKNSFDDMSKEEQEVILNFHGSREDYENVCANADYYLVKSSDLLMIEQTA